MRKWGHREVQNPAWSHTAIATWRPIPKQTKVPHSLGYSASLEFYDRHWNMQMLYSPREHIQPQITVMPHVLHILVKTPKLVVFHSFQWTTNLQVLSAILAIGVSSNRCMGVRCSFTSSEGLDNCFFTSFQRLCSWCWRHSSCPW